MSKLLARSIGKGRETQSESELGSTVFENNRRDSIWTVSLPGIKTREGMENVILKNFYFRDEVVRGWTSRRNMPICNTFSLITVVAASYDKGSRVMGVRRVGRDPGRDAQTSSTIQMHLR